MRVGEMLALTIGDVALDAGREALHAALQRTAASTWWVLALRPRPEAYAGCGRTSASESASRLVRRSLQRLRASKSLPPARSDRAPPSAPRGCEPCPQPRGAARAAARSRDRPTLPDERGNEPVELLGVLHKHKVLTALSLLEDLQLRPGDLLRRPGH